MPESDNLLSAIDDEMSAQDHEYNSSGSSTRHSTSDIFGHDVDDELEQMKSRASSRSSLSSAPASVLIHPTHQSKAMFLHEKIAGYTIEDDEESFGGFDDLPRSMRTLRPREAGFRKPSSVRAMQMHTEDEADDDEYLTPPRRRAGMRSPGNSTLKRSPYYSPKSVPEKPKATKEFPLVLLHCNLLAPSIPVRGAADAQNQGLVEEVLPPQYWKRWRRLQEKVGSGVVRERGVLISHPEDLYDVLEDRLLESLELQRARVNHGHFLGNGDSDPGSEGEISDKGESDTDGEQGEECPDCGGHVLGHSNNNRKWELRVYAANGLMGAGAWAAAWREMEKVDVEVGLWLPSDVRRALEKRIAEERSPSHESSLLALPAAEEAAKSALVLHSGLGDDQTNAFSEAGSIRLDAPPPMLMAADTPVNPQKMPVKEHEIALPTLLINYIRVLASDKRNIALGFMSVLIVFLSIGAGPQFSAIPPLFRSSVTGIPSSPAAPPVEIVASTLSQEVASMTSSSARVLDEPLVAVAQDDIQPSNYMKAVAGSNESSGGTNVPQTGESIEERVETDETSSTYSGASADEAYPVEIHGLEDLEEESSHADPESGKNIDNESLTGLSDEANLQFGDDRTIELQSSAIHHPEEETEVPDEQLEGPTFEDNPETSAKTFGGPEIEFGHSKEDSIEPQTIENGPKDENNEEVAKWEVKESEDTKSEAPVLEEPMPEAGIESPIPHETELEFEREMELSIEEPTSVDLPDKSSKFISSEPEVELERTSFDDSKESDFQLDLPGAGSLEED